MIPVTFLMLALWNQGIGSHPIRGFNQEQLSEKLNLESYERPIIMLVIGYPEEEQEEKWRRDPEEVVDFL